MSWSQEKNKSALPTIVHRSESLLRTLRTIIRDTQEALADLDNVIEIESAINDRVQAVCDKSSREVTSNVSLVVFGSDNSARASFVNSLLGETLLSTQKNKEKWYTISIEYGEKRQAHLSLSNSDFEICDFSELENSWNCDLKNNTPLQDLTRKDAEDISIFLKIEIKNHFLENGLKILLPPDFSINTIENNISTLRDKSADFYEKRSHVLESCLPVYIYVLNKTCECYDYSFFLNEIDRNCFLNHGNDDEDAFCRTYSKLEQSSDVKMCDISDNNMFCERLAEGCLFHSENILDLEQIRSVHPSQNVNLVLLSDSVDCKAAKNNLECRPSEDSSFVDSTELTEADRYIRNAQRCSEVNEDAVQIKEENLSKMSHFMCDLVDRLNVIFGGKTNNEDWFIMDTTAILESHVYRNKHKSRNSKKGSIEKKIRLVNNIDNLMTKMSSFISSALNMFVLHLATRLSEIHILLMQRFFHVSFDMAREIQVVPTKVHYVSCKENQLYNMISEKFNEGSKRQELIDLIESALTEIKNEISNSVDWLCEAEDSFPTLSMSFTISQDYPNFSNLEEAIPLEDFDIINSSNESLFMDESCNESLFTSPVNDESTLECYCHDYRNDAAVRKANADLHSAVLRRLSEKISSKVNEFIDCLKEGYFGTMQRCLESLEQCSRNEMNSSREAASQAIKQLFSSAKYFHLPPNTNTSLLKSIIHTIKRIFYRVGLGVVQEERLRRLKGACVRCSTENRKRKALEAIGTLSATHLATLVSQQIMDRVKNAHEKFQSSLGSLQAALALRIHHTEDNKLALRKHYAPNFARLCLESSSLCDLLKHGAPKIGKEIGRGQYGIVFSCRSWGNRGKCAVKSVLPVDQKHFNELAMEYFYTRSVPRHRAVVALWGVVLQKRSMSKEVLLISERKESDLHSALKSSKLSFAQRIKIAIDIVQGIRYLHSLGLVHRDIKLKNVLLDRECRASLSDLGFCSSRALLSGSLVGTPVHMAPELLTAHYDASVDVYAFAITFWYLCANSVRLPEAFETFQNKEQLWNKVVKGLRPERLGIFTDECWGIMQMCWASDPNERALLGDVEPLLQKIYDEAFKDEQNAQNSQYKCSYDSDYDIV